MNEQRALASVVVPTIGRLGLLEQCLRSVLACDPPPAEIVVVDQSDGPGVAELLSALDSSALDASALDSSALVRVHDRGRGIGRALNRGVQAARHELLLVTHDDCIVDAAWAATGAALLSSRPGWLVTGRVEPVHGAAHVPSCKSDSRPEDHRGSARFDLLYCNNWGARRADVLSIDGFDERRGLRLAAEDCDFCYRWTSAGRGVRYDPTLVVTHQDWRTEPALRRMYRTYSRGSGAFYAKHLLRGDNTLLPWVLRDLRRGLRASLHGRRTRMPAGHDPERGILLGLPQGLAAGVLEELSIRRLTRTTPR